MGKERYKESYSPILEFNKLPEKDTIPFLFERLGSSAPTLIHICPSQNAMEGELALYLLAIINREPWFISLGRESWVEQEEVQGILRDSENRESIIEYYTIGK